jgi:hypothetical protein
MRIVVCFLIFALCFLSCSKGNHKNPENDTAKGSTARQLNESIDTTKCLVIKERINLFLQYDSIETAQMSKDGSLDAVIDDMNYYQSNAEEELSNNGIKSTYADRGCLYFINDRNDTFHFEHAALDTVDMVLFNGTDRPLLTNSTSYSDKFRGYYHLQPALTDSITTDSAAIAEPDSSRSNL